MFYKSAAKNVFIYTAFVIAFSSLQGSLYAYGKVCKVTPTPTMTHIPKTPTPQIHKHDRILIRPFVECVLQLPNGNLQVYFGYENKSVDQYGKSMPVTLPVGNNNKMIPALLNGTQTTVFNTGLVKKAFRIEMEVDKTATWVLLGHRAFASNKSKSCPTIVLTPVISPVATKTVNLEVKPWNVGQSVTYEQRFSLNGAPVTLLCSYSIVGEYTSTEGMHYSWLEKSSQNDKGVSVIEKYLIPVPNDQTIRGFIAGGNTDVLLPRRYIIQRADDNPKEFKVEGKLLGFFREYLSGRSTVFERVFCSFMSMPVTQIQTPAGQLTAYELKGNIEAVALSVWNSNEIPVFGVARIVEEPKGRGSSATDKVEIIVHSYGLSGATSQVTKTPYYIDNEMAKNVPGLSAEEYFGLNK